MKAVRLGWGINMTSAFILKPQWGLGGVVLTTSQLMLLDDHCLSKYCKHDMSPLVICVTWFLWGHLSACKYTDCVKPRGSSDLLASFPLDCDSCNAVHTLHHPVAPGQGFRRHFVKGIYNLVVMHFLGIKKMRHVYKARVKEVFQFMKWTR